MSDSQVSAEAMAMKKFIEELYPVCRSITGDGLRKTLSRIAEEIPVEFTEVPSGTSVFDWKVPKEWNIRRAFLEDPHGRRIVDFDQNNLHVLNYSVPVDKTVSLDELQEHLFSLPEHPDWIPYRTSYYSENWGFCLRHRDRVALQDGNYRALIDADLAEGSLTLAEVLIPGHSDEEILVYSHACHPSLANDNLSGLAVTVWWAKYLATKKDRRYSYRFVWGPGTIGSISWLAMNQERLTKVRHGLVAVLLGRPGPFRLKKSRIGECDIERVSKAVLSDTPSGYELLEFDPYGYDERQFCSPGINLNLCRLSRAAHGEYPEYHTSADNLDLIDSSALSEALDACIAIGNMLDANRVFVNQLPNCEPQLGKRGLYGGTGGTSPKHLEHAMLWVLSLSDGAHSMLDIAERSGAKFEVISEAATMLDSAGFRHPGLTWPGAEALCSRDQ
jgi:aminopeptidase-like protein